MARKITTQMVRNFYSARMKDKNYVGYVGRGVYKIGEGFYTNIFGWKKFQEALIKAAKPRE